MQCVLICARIKWHSWVITASDVSTAIKAQNIQAPVGAIGSRPTENAQEFKYSANAQGRLKNPEEFGDIIISTKMVKL
jgi:HAE1 family hydrophobic/amphiphilic exporter-1